MENPYINFTNLSEQITEFCTFLLSFVSFGTVLFSLSYPDLEFLLDFVTSFLCCEVLSLLLSPLFNSFIGITAPGPMHIAVQRGANSRIGMQISSTGVAFGKV